jgi:hypothetical protein
MTRAAEGGIIAAATRSFLASMRSATPPTSMDGGVHALHALHVHALHLQCIAVGLSASLQRAVAKGS